MADKYFEKFPIINYANNQAIDVTERVIFTDNTLKNPYVFYSYDLDHHERPDQFAYRYYGDQFYSWLLYLTNNITDPYYDWYIREDELNSFVTMKYGSVEKAQLKISFYRSNWELGNTLSVSGFNALPASLMHYWEEQYDMNGNVMSYVRKKEDIIVNTNQIVAYPVSNTDFIKDEVVNIHFDNETTGRGQVVFTANGYVYLQHTVGYAVGNKLTITANTAGFDGGTAMIYFTDADKYFDVDEEVYYEVPENNTAVSSLIANNHYYIKSVNSTGFVLTSVIGGPAIGLNDIRINSPGEVHYIIPPYVKQGYNLSYITPTSYIYGTESGVNTSISSSTVYAQNFDSEEASYYSAVTYYDYEVEKNESKKSIKVLDQKYAKQTSNIVKKLLK